MKKKRNRKKKNARLAQIEKDNKLHTTGVPASEQVKHDLLLQREKEAKINDLDASHVHAF